MPVSQTVSADALLGECIDYLKVRFDSDSGLVTSALVEIQFALTQWFPTWPAAGRLADIGAEAGVDLDTLLLTPVAVAAELQLPLAAASAEVAEIARPHVTSVVLV